MSTDYATIAHELLGADAEAIARAPSATARIDLRKATGIEALMALRQDWASLAAALPEAGFHQAYGWYLSYLCHLEPHPASLHFFSFYRGSRPIAIVPLRHVKRRSPTGVPLWLWELPFHPHMNLCDCIMARPDEDGAALMRLLVDTLSRGKDMPWDALHLPNLIDDAQALGALRAAALPRTLFVESGQSMYFPCHDTASAMRACMPKFRRNLRRQRKKLEQLGRVEMSLAQDRAALDDAFAAFLRIEASGWKGDRGRGSAIMLHPNLTRFYRDLIDSFASEGRCLIALLKLDGIPVAGQFGLVAGKTLHLLKIAYDEAFRAAAPGNQLLHDMLEYCCESRSITRLSLVTGPAWVAGRWNPEAHGRWDAYVFNANVRGLSAYAAMRLKSSVAVMARTKPWWPARRQTSRDITPM